MHSVWPKLAYGGIAALAGSISIAARSAEIVDMHSLRERLLSVAEDRLRPAGVLIDREHVWMSLSGPLPAAEDFDIRPTWSTDTSHLPLLPLTFELRSRVRADASTLHIYERTTPSAASIKVTLAVSLLRDVWVAKRRLRKGSTLACGDIDIQRRRISQISQPVAPTSCGIGAEAVALHDLTRGDVIRAIDVGSAPAVLAGTPVRINVATGAIKISTTAIALTDAQVGDQIDVRLQRPTRTLRTRVIGPGSVQLSEGPL